MQSLYEACEEEIIAPIDNSRRLANCLLTSLGDKYCYLLSRQKSRVAVCRQMGDHVD